MMKQSHHKVKSFPLLGGEQQVFVDCKGRSGQKQSLTSVIG